MLQQVLREQNPFLMNSVVNVAQAPAPRLKCNHSCALLSQQCLHVNIFSSLGRNYFPSKDMESMGFIILFNKQNEHAETLRNGCVGFPHSEPSPELSASPPHPGQGQSLQGPYVL